MVTGFALAPSRVVVLAPRRFEIVSELVGKPPRQIVFLDAGHCARAGREIPCAPRPRLPVRRRRDHVGEHVENLAQRSDRDIKQATAATDALLGNASHVAKGAKRRGTPGAS